MGLPPSFWSHTLMWTGSPAFTRSGVASISTRPETSTGFLTATSRVSKALMFSPRAGAPSTWVLPRTKARARAAAAARAASSPALALLFEGSALSACS